MTALNRILITGDSVAADTDIIANDIAPADGVAITLLITAVSDGLAHKIIVTNNSSTDYSTGGKVLAVVGTDANGYPQTESITGPAGSTTSSSTKYFRTITSITPNFSRTTTDTFDIGYTAAAVTAWDWSPMKEGWGPNGLAFAVVVDSGSPTYSVQHTYDGGVTAFTHSTVTGETTSQEGTYTTPIQGIRLIWSAAGEATLHGYF